MYVDNKSEMARLLGLSRQSIYNLLESGTLIEPVTIGQLEAYNRERMRQADLEIKRLQALSEGLRAYKN